MIPSKAFPLWPIPPIGFDNEPGAEGGEGGGAGGEGATGGTGPAVTLAQPKGQQQEGQGSQSDSDTDDDDDDDDDILKGLTPAQLRQKLKEEKAAAAQAKKDKKALEDEKDSEARKKKSKEDNLTADLQKANNTVDTLRSTNTRLAIVNGILNTPEYQWHNAEIVAQQLESGEVTVDPETGKVEGLKKALKRIADNHDYLLRSAPSDDKGKGGNGNTKREPYSGIPTGIKPGQGGSTGGGLQQPTNAQLIESYPALAGRIPVGNSK